MNRISLFGRTDQYFIWNSIFTGQRYANMLLRLNVIIYAASIANLFECTIVCDYIQLDLWEVLLKLKRCKFMHWHYPINYFETQSSGERNAASSDDLLSVQDFKTSLFGKWNFQTFYGLFLIFHGKQMVNSIICLKGPDS